MSRYSDIDPMDIDPDTGRPYAGYSSPSLDTSFHDREMAGDEHTSFEIARDRIMRACGGSADLRHKLHTDAVTKAMFDVAARELADEIDRKRA